MTTETDENRDYYYVTYQGTGVNGCICIPQHKHVSGGKNPDGFNLASATQYLVQIFQTAIIVTSWRQITRKRRDEFERYIELFIAAQGLPPPPGKPRPTHLSLVIPIRPPDETIPPPPAT